MNLNDLEYANLALKSLINHKPVEKFVFYNALNGISDFLKSEMDDSERQYINENVDVFIGISNILQRYYEGSSCISEIIEANYSDFNKLINHLYGIQ